jgi:hypothetical protein
MIKLNRLLQRYINVRKELDNQQTIERKKMEKSFKSNESMSRSHISGSPSKKSLNASRISNSRGVGASRPSNK